MPHINVITKCDLLAPEEVDAFFTRAEEGGDGGGVFLRAAEAHQARPGTGGKWARLTNALQGVLDDVSLVSYLPLDQRDEESIAMVLAACDHAYQFFDNVEAREPRADDREGRDLSGG